MTVKINISESNVMSYEAILSEIVSLTHHMLAFAEKDDWEQVMIIENQQSSLLAEMKERHLPLVLDGDVIENKLKLLIDLNSRLTVLGEMKKAECFSLLNSGKNDVKAFNAYTSY